MMFAGEERQGHGDEAAYADSPGQEADGRLAELGVDVVDVDAGADDPAPGSCP